MLRVARFLSVPLLLLAIALGVLALTSKPAQPAAVLSSFAEQPLVIAHRGGKGLWPENSLFAFQRASALGVDMLEMDLHLSSDGELVVIHDSTLDRTTNGQGAARVQSWDALSRLDAGSWHGRIYAGESLLRLEALSRWLQALGLMVNLELKPAMGEERRTGQVVAQRVAQWWRDSEVKPLLSSFSVEALEAARDAAPALPRALLLDRWQIDGVQQAVQLGCVAMVVHHSFLDARRIDAIHEMGLKALAYTVNELDRAEALWAAGLDGLITDRVDFFDPQSG